MTRPQTATRDSAGAPAPTAASLLVVMLLVGAILINVVQFRAIDEGTVDNFDAVRRSDTADAVQLWYGECRWCRDRFEPHLALRVVAPGSTVYVPASSPYRVNRYLAEELTFRLYSLAEVAEVKLVNYRQDSQLLSSGTGPPGTGFDPTRYIVASGRGGQKGAPWALAIASPDQLPGATADPDDYLARAVRDGAHRRQGGPPREFVLLRWEVPRKDSARPYQDLLLETALLPDRAREELTR